MTTPTFLNIGTRISASSGTSATPTINTTKVNGNIVLAVVGSKNNATHSCSTAGWVKLDQRNSGTLWTVSLWAAFVTGTLASPAVTWTGSVANFAQIYQYTRDAFDISETVAQAVKIGAFNTGTTSTHSLASFNSTKANSLALYIFGTSANTAYATPSGWTEDVDSTGATGATRNGGGRKSLTTSGSASGAISITAGNAAWVGWALEMTESTFPGDSFGLTDSDDCYSDGTSLYAGSGFDIIQGNSAGQLRQAGFRFQNVNIPKNAYVSEAYLRVRQKSSIGGTSGFGSFFGDKVANAAAWGSSSRPDQITKTTASALALGGTTNGVWWQHDIKTIVQELVNQATWSAGNAMRFAGDNSASTGVNVGYYNNESGSSNAAKLWVRWGWTVADTNDDGYSNGSTWNSGSISVGGSNWAGLRFQNIIVPKNSVITSATLGVSRGLGGPTGSSLGNWYGDNVDNAPAWSSSSRPDQITKTTGSALVVSTSDGVKNFVDVTAIVQQIVNRSGWASGNAIRFGADPAGATNTSDLADYTSYTAASLGELRITWYKPPIITSSNSGSVAENSTLSFSLTADESVTWSVLTSAQNAASVDYTHFEVSGSTLRWTSNGTKDYETPTDTGTNNTYVVVVRATDTDGYTADQTVTITVTDLAAPSITSGTSTSVAENAALSFALTASTSVTWTIRTSAQNAASTDDMRFQISGSNLVWASGFTPDYEVPVDSNTNNTYAVVVRGTAANGEFAESTITVTVTDVNEAPTITSSASASVSENATLSHSLTADKSVTWTIRSVGQNGASVDASAFELSGSTLRWASNGTKDYETPTDTGSNNTYVVVVRATDAGSLYSEQTITVTVTNVAEGGGGGGGTIDLTLGAADVMGSYQGYYAGLGGTLTPDVVNGHSIMAILTSIAPDTLYLVASGDVTAYLGASSIYVNGVECPVISTSYDSGSDSSNVMYYYTSLFINGNTYTVTIPATAPTIVTQIILGQNSTWTVPAGVTKLTRLMLQGAGGNGYRATTNMGVAPGGGGGSFLQFSNVTVTPGAVYDVNADPLGTGSSGSSTYYASVFSSQSNPTDYASASNGEDAVAVSGSGWGGGGGTSYNGIFTTPAIDHYGGDGGASGDNYGGGGGGGAAYQADGRKGGESWNSSVASGGGGAGAGVTSSTDGSNPIGTTGGNGGYGSDAGGAGATSSSSSQNAAAGSGGGGGGGSSTSPYRDGANGAFIALFTDNSGGANNGISVGPGGGGGGRGVGDTTAKGGNGGYGAGGGGGASATGQKGGAGYIVIQYVLPSDTTAPTITSSNSISVNENATLSHSLTANESVTWTITGGSDSAKFELSGSTLRWASNGTKNYEAPDDSDTNNIYQVTVKATDAATNFSTQTISVNVNNVAEGAGGNASFSLTASTYPSGGHKGFYLDSGTLGPSTTYDAGAVTALFTNPSTPNAVSFYISGDVATALTNKIIKINGVTFSSYYNDGTYTYTPSFYSGTTSVTWSAPGFVFVEGQVYNIQITDPSYIFKGSGNRSSRYKGVRNDAQIYKGKSLGWFSG